MKLNELESLILAKKPEIPVRYNRAMIKILRHLLKGPKGPEVMRTLLK